MSNRDYANRKPQSGAKAKPRATRTKANPAPRKQKLSLLLIAIVIFAVGCFGYFLFSIKHNVGQAVITPAKNSSAPRSQEKQVEVLAPQVKGSKQQGGLPDKEAGVIKPQKDLHALPPRPKEQWTYLSELQNKNVEVDIPDVVTSRTPLQYQLQCASFRQESQANEMKAVIAFQGLEAKVSQIEGTTGTWYRVSLGPYARKRDAERQRHTLQNVGINGCQLLAIAK